MSTVFRVRSNSRKYRAGNSSTSRSSKLRLSNSTRMVMGFLADGESSTLSGTARTRAAQKPA